MAARKFAAIFLFYSVALWHCLMGKKKSKKTPNYRKQEVSSSLNKCNKLACFLCCDGCLTLSTTDKDGCLFNMKVTDLHQDSKFVMVYKF
ncbi:unnamed protein product [Lactuca virosa]|uniref:Uncharacterized protein n=1 Tax=Lactuca virosa TaxID=75947 RepID=A0AAU9MVF7_9ASTR|nr:unnamed protein product [Lactuca virosa]